MNSRLARRHKPKKPKNKLFFKMFLRVAAVLFLIFGAWYLAINRNWDGKSKISLAISKDDGSASVVILDPSVGSLTTINIPKNTLVTASHDLGQWRLASIWKLGADEKLNPLFFRSTIAKSFKFPIEAWGNESFINLLNGTLAQRLKALFSRETSDFNFIDRFQSLWFSLFLKNGRWSQISLEESGYLKKTKLPDGTLGWAVGNDIPLSIASLFVNHNLENLKVEIIDSNKSGVVVDSILNTLGIKVAVINHTNIPDQKCEIITENSTAGLRLSKIFGCEFKNTSTGDNFDVKIILTGKFSQSF